LEKTEIAVGDSAELEIILSTKTYKSRVTKRPRIQTNEGPPDKHVTITAHVVPRPDSTYPIIISPYKLDLSQFSQKTIDRIDFEIQNVSDRTLDLKLIAAASEYFDVDLPSSIAPGATAAAKLTLKGDMTEKSFDKSFTLELNDDSTSRFTIPVKRTVRKPNQPSKTRVLPRSGK